MRLNSPKSTRGVSAGGPLALLGRVLRRRPSSFEAHELEHLRTTLDVADHDRIWAFIVVLLYAISKIEEGIKRSMLFVAIAVGVLFVSQAGAIYFDINRQGRNQNFQEVAPVQRQSTCSELHDPDYCAAVSLILASGPKQRVVEWVARLDEEVATRLARWPELDRELSYLSTLNPQQLEAIINARRSTDDVAHGGRHK